MFSTSRLPLMAFSSIFSNSLSFFPSTHVYLSHPFLVIWLFKISLFIDLNRFQSTLPLPFLPLGGGREEGRKEGREREGRKKGVKVIQKSIESIKVKKVGGWKIKIHNELSQPRLIFSQSHGTINRNHLFKFQ